MCKSTSLKKLRPHALRSLKPTPQVLKPISLVPPGLEGFPSRAETPPGLRPLPDRGPDPLALTCSRRRGVGRWRALDALQ